MRILENAKRIYTSRYALLNAASFIGFYYLLEYVLSAQQHGIPISSVPVSMIYALSLSSSFAFTVSIFYILRSVRNASNITAGGATAATAVVGGIVSGCGCQAAILSGIIAPLAGAGEATLLSTVVSENASLIFSALIILNIGLGIYYLNRPADPACKPKKGKWDINGKNKKRAKAQ